MMSDSNRTTSPYKRKIPRGALAPSPLTGVLGQSKEAQDLVVEAADELSTVNSSLKLELTDTGASSTIEAALEKSEAVEDKVNDASEKLALVNVALKNEVRERHALEDQLALVSEQADVDRHAALHDVLTGLPNRTLFGAMYQAKQTKSRISFAS